MWDFRWNISSITKQKASFCLSKGLVTLQTSSELQGELQRTHLSCKPLKLHAWNAKLDGWSLVRDTPSPWDSLNVLLNPGKWISSLSFKIMALGRYHLDGACKTVAWEQLTESSWFYVDVLPTCLDIPSPILASLKSTVIPASKVILHLKSDHSIPLPIPSIDSPCFRKLITLSFLSQILSYIF